MPRLLSDRLQHGFAERDAEILHGVMLIDVEIALGLDAQVEAAVAREELQHVIEEPDAGRDVVLAPPVEDERQADNRFGGPPIDYRAAHRTSSSTASPFRVCSTIPVVIRMQPAQPGSLERSRR